MYLVILVDEGIILLLFGNDIVQNLFFQSELGHLEGQYFQGLQ